MRLSAQTRNPDAERRPLDSGFARRRAPRNDEGLRSVRRHEDREPEPGEMMQRLIDADQPPEPLMVHRDVEGGDAKALGAIDDEVDRKIDKRDEPEFRRDEQNQQHRYRKVDKTMRQQRQRPAGLL